MEAVITKAAAADLPAVAQIYEDIIARQDRGGPYIGWQSGVYPTLETARAALERDELFVQRRGEKVVGSAIINQTQVDVYAQAAWQYPAQDSQVMVLHTLVIDPSESAHGYGGQFAAFKTVAPTCALTPMPATRWPVNSTKNWAIGRWASSPADLTASRI